MWNLYFLNNQKITAKNLIVTAPFPQSKNFYQNLLKKIYLEARSKWIQL